MENKQDGITLFDTLFTNNHICIMKLLLPLLSPSKQKNLAIYIKFLELQYTLQYFSHHPQGLCFSTQNTGASYDIENVFDNFLPYCTPREKDNIMQIRNLMNNFHNLQDMMEMINTMKELFPENFDPTENGGLFGNFSPEMFENISSMFGNPPL